jgi:hypothetical protein
MRVKSAAVNGYEAEKEAIRELPVICMTEPNGILQFFGILADLFAKGTDCT